MPGLVTQKPKSGPPTRGTPLDIGSYLGGAGHQKLQPFQQDWCIPGKVLRKSKVFMLEIGPCSSAERLSQLTSRIKLLFHSGQIALVWPAASGQ